MTMPENNERDLGWDDNDPSTGRNEDAVPDGDAAGDDASPSELVASGDDPPEVCPAEDEEEIDLPATMVEQLVDMVQNIKRPRPHKMKEIIVRAFESGLAPADMALLYHVMSELTGVPTLVYRQMLVDHRNTAQDEILSCEADGTRSVLAALRQAYQMIVYWGGKLWVYPTATTSPEAGYFSSNSRDEIEKLLLADYGAMPLFTTKGKRAEVIHRLTQEMSDETFFDHPSAGANLANGFLVFDRDVGDVVLKPHSPDHKARWLLHEEWCPTAVAPIFEAGLARTFRDKQNELAFLEFCGCALLGATPGNDNVRHALLMVGPKNCGKTTLQEAIKLLFPPYAVSAISPENWKSDYHKARLVGKALNVVAEVGSKKVFCGDAFKSIIGWDLISSREIYQPVVEFHCRAWHVFSANSVPRIDDQDAAVSRRLLAIQLDQTLADDEKDPLFLEKVQGELPGVIALLVKHALEALRRGSFTVPPSHDQVLVEMQYGNDVVARFVLTQFETAPMTAPGPSTTTITTHFIAYAERQGLDTEGWDSLKGKKTIARLLKSFYGAVRYQVDGLPHYRGVRLKRQLS